VNDDEFLQIKERVFASITIQQATELYSACVSSAGGEESKVAKLLNSLQWLALFVAHPPRPNKKMKLVQRAKKSRNELRNALLALASLARAIDASLPQALKDLGSDHLKAAEEYEAIAARLPDFEIERPQIPGTDAYVLNMLVGMFQMCQGSSGLHANGHLVRFIREGYKLVGLKHRPSPEALEMRLYRLRKESRQIRT
jgi:hypothetical protein